MATAISGRADKGMSQAPARSARPCSAAALRFGGRAGAKTIPRPPDSTALGEKIDGDNFAGPEARAFHLLKKLDLGSAPDAKLIIHSTRECRRRGCA
jgi:hypothetical protein